MNAFPNVHDPKTGSMSHGMSLRDYFAAHAMSAMLEQMFKARPSDEAIDSAIAGCYKIADAMMKARDL